MVLPEANNYILTARRLKIHIFELHLQITQPHHVNKIAKADRAFSNALSSLCSCFCNLFQVASQAFSFFASAASACSKAFLAFSTSFALCLAILACTFDFSFSGNLACKFLARRPRHNLSMCDFKIMSSDNLVNRIGD